MCNPSLLAYNLPYIVIKYYEHTIYVYYKGDKNNK